MLPRWDVRGNTLSTFSAPPTHRPTRLIIFGTSTRSGQTKKWNNRRWWVVCTNWYWNNAHEWFHLRAIPRFLLCFECNKSRAIFGGRATRLIVADQASFFARTMRCLSPLCRRVATAPRALSRSLASADVLFYKTRTTKPGFQAQVGICSPIIIPIRSRPTVAGETLLMQEAFHPPYTFQCRGYKRWSRFPEVVSQTRTAWYRSNSAEKYCIAAETTMQTGLSRYCPPPTR